MDSLITSDSFELQLKFENCLRLLTKKHNELSKKFTTNLDRKDSKFKVTIVLPFLMLNCIIILINMYCNYYIDCENSISNSQKISSTDGTKN